MKTWNKYPLRVCCRPLLLFFCAYIFVYAFHEFSHAVTAYLLKVNFTLHALTLDYNEKRIPASNNIRIAFLAPLFSLCLGLLTWLLYKQSKNAARKLFFLYAAIIGIDLFLGNLFAIMSGGDFHTAVKLIDPPSWTLYIVSIIGLFFLILFMYRSGKQFLIFNLHGTKSSLVNIFFTMFIPAVAGTAIVLFSYLPLPANLITGIVFTNSFWLFSIRAAYKNREMKTNKTVLPAEINRWDLCLFLFAVILVRLMVAGIPFHQ